MVPRGYDLYAPAEENPMTPKTLHAVRTLLILALAAPLLAHHSSAGAFDTQKSVATEGVITKLVWANPHSVLYLDVKDARGGTEAWILYGLPPNMLSRQGYTKETFKEGLRVAAIGNPARNSSALRLVGYVPEPTDSGKALHIMEVGEIRFADGQVASFGRGPAFDGRTFNERLKK
jgi:hypothetical protein